VLVAACAQLVRALRRHFPDLVTAFVDVRPERCVAGFAGDRSVRAARPELARLVAVVALEAHLRRTVSHLTLTVLSNAIVAIMPVFAERLGDREVPDENESHCDHYQQQHGSDNVFRVFHVRYGL